MTRARTETPVRTGRRGRPPVERNALVQVVKCLLIGLGDRETARALGMPQATVCRYAAAYRAGQLGDVGRDAAQEVLAALWRSGLVAREDLEEAGRCSVVWREMAEGSDSCVEGRCWDVRLSRRRRSRSRREV